MNFLRALDISERLHLCQGILSDGFRIVIVTGVGVGTVWFWFTPFRAWYNLTQFPEMTKPLLVHKVWSDVGVCFLFQIFFFFFFLQLVTFCFLTPPFASVACHLPRSPENRMELHKSLTCCRWPYESCMSTLINTGRLLWPRNGYAPPGQGRAGRPAWTPPGPQSVKSFPNPISVSPPVSRTVNQGGELLVFGDVV